MDPFRWAQVFHRLFSQGKIWMRKFKIMSIHFFFYNEKSSKLELYRKITYYQNKIILKFKIFNCHHIDPNYRYYLKYTLISSHSELPKSNPIHKSTIFHPRRYKATNYLTTQSSKFCKPYFQNTGHNFNYVS